MNALGETLSTLTSQIKFVSANNPGGGGGTLVPQTGDIIGIILAIVAAVAIIAVGFIVASSKLRSSENISGGAIAKNKAIGIALSVVAVLSLAGILYCYMPSWIANAENTQATNQATGNTVYAYVDEVTGEITFDENFIKNETNFEVSLASSRAVMTDEVANIEGIDKVVFGIEALDSVVYYDTLAKPGEQREAFQPTMHGTLMPGEQAAVKYSIENCDKILARALIGKTVVTTSVDEVNCLTVTYQVSSGESIEGEVPEKQVLVPGQSVTVANYDTLYKWGYSGKPSYWVGSDDKNYNVDQAIKYEDLTKNLTLQTAIDGWVEDDPVTIYYDTEVVGVFEATSDSETILPVSGNPEGCTVTLTSDFQLDCWYNTETGEEVGWETTFTPPRNEHGIYEETVYSVRLSLVEEDTADEPQADNASVTLKYVANTGGIVTLGSETLESETSTPQGSEAKAGKGFKFDHWNNAAGEEISREAKLIPQTEGGVYKSTTYTAMFVYDPSPYPVDPLCYNVYFESADTAQGTVSTSFVLTTASPYYTYEIDENVITVASSNTSKSYTIHADGKDGYVFSSWTLIDAAGKVVKLSNNGVPIASNLRFVANFVPEGESYQVNFAATDGGDPVSPSTITMAAGTGYTINKDVITFEDEAGTVVTANEAWADYRFVKWEVSPTDTGSVDQALTFTAKYSKNTGEMCTLTLKCWGTRHGSPDKDTVEVPAGTHYQIITSGKNIGDVIFTDEAGAEIERISFTVENGYKVKGWSWYDEWAGSIIPVDDEGTVEESFTFYYEFEVHKVTITYSVLDVNTPQGDIIANGSSEHKYVVTEEVSKLNPSYIGASAYNWEESDNKKFMSTWNGWTNNLDGRKLSNQHLTSKDVKKFCEAIWEEQGWCDITFTAHFLSAKAIYVPSTGEFNFYYDEGSHNEAGIDDYKFGVNNSHIDLRTLDISLKDVVFPSWYWPDGTPKVYPTSVHFDKSFKSYNNLTSMSLWFLSGMFDKSVLAYNNAAQGSSVFNDWFNNFESNVFSLKGQYQPRAITSVTGLENVNTEKLKETAFMFAGSVSDAPLVSLDFSSWNTPVLNDTTGMFMYCTYLTDIKFPPTGSGRSFAQTATMMPYMFAMCVSLQNITLPANFGEGAFYMQYMFVECLSLKHFKAEAPKFGANAYNMSHMFFNCQAMHTLELNNNGFGSSCEYAYQMFENCASLTSVDLSSFYAWDEDSSPNFDPDRPHLDYDGADDMLYGCDSLTEIKISVNFQVDLNYDCGLDDYDDEGWQYYNWYFYGTPIDMYGDVYCLNGIRNVIDARAFSGIATFRQPSAKAVYNGSSLDFYYDHETHDGVIYNVRPSGIFGDLPFLKTAGNKKHAPGFNRLSESNMVSANLLSLINLPSFYASTLISYIFPDWYDVYVSADGKVTVKCAVDASTVNFDASFYDFDDLYSTACWFCADSYGYQPFQTFNGLNNLPMYNLETCSCMFGGFSSEVILNELAIVLYQEFGDMYIDYDVTQASAFDNMTDNLVNVVADSQIGIKQKGFAGMPAAAAGALLGYIYFADTYGTSLRSFDFNALNPVIKLSESADNNDNFGDSGGSRLSFGYGNYSGMFANCVNLQSVTFPTWSGPHVSQDNAVEKGMVSWYGYYIENADMMFYNCESLETLNNFENFYSEDLETCSMMFYNCKSLKKLDFSNWDTYYVYHTNMPNFDEDGNVTPMPFASCNDMLKGCDRLVEVTFPESWNLPVNQCGLADNWETTGDVNYAWTYKEDGQPYHTVDMLGLTQDVSVPDLWHNTKPGTYTRNRVYLNNYNISINSEDESTGTVTPSGDAIRSYSDKLEYCVDDYGLLVGNTRVQATPADGYKLAYWTVEDDSGTVSRVEQVDVCNVYYSRLIEHALPLVSPLLTKVFYSEIQAILHDGFVPEEIRELYEMVSYLYNASTNAMPSIQGSNAKFVAHFAKEGATAKAVYVENAVVDGRTENALYMYYDELDHSTEGTVFPIYENTGYSQHPDIQAIRTEIINFIQSGILNIYAQEGSVPPMEVVMTQLLPRLQEYINRTLPSAFQSTTVKAPSWFYHTYATVNELDIARRHDPKYQEEFKPLAELAAAASASSSASLAFNDTDFGYAEEFYLKEYRDRFTKSYFECVIDPESVVFTDSFSQFDTLQSMSMWFMADSNGKQTFKHFYSPAPGEQPSSANEGFANVNTKSLQNMQYAFGGYIDHSYTRLINEYYQKPKAPEFIVVVDDPRMTIEDVDRQMVEEGMNPMEEYQSSALDLALDWTAELAFFDLGYGDAFQSFGTSIEKLDLSTLDLSHTKNWSYMLANAVGLKEVTFSENVKNMYPNNLEGLFWNCENLGSSIDGKSYNENPIINIDKFNTEAVTNMDYLFYGDSHLVTLDLSSFVTNKISNTPVFIKAKEKVIQDKLLADRYTGEHYAKEMFTECYRLNKLYLNSVYDPSYKSGIEGWDLNLSGCGLIDMPNGGDPTDPSSYLTWTNVDTKTPGLFSIDIPLNPGLAPASWSVLSGEFRRDMIGQQTINVANQVDEETQETMGTINGEDEYEYGFIVNATMKTDASVPNVLWVDNVRLEAQPKEGYRFQYWRFADNFYIWNPDTETYEDVSGQIVPDNFSYVVYAQEIMATKLHYGFVACYTDGDTSAKAIFAQNATGEVVFDFVYDNVTYEVGEMVPHLEGYKVLAIYDVSHNTTDYNLPSWYRVTSQTYRADDDHYLPAFDKTIEANVPKDAKGLPMDGSLQIKFEESFLGYDELTSLSCWFMPALRGNALFSPFNVASMTGLQNINTLRVNNVAYMFGGHEYFNEINGSKYPVINLNGFNAAPLTNFNGMFANCLQLRSLTLDDTFSYAQPLSTSKMFFNCRTLTGGNLRNVLSKLDTSQVTDMSYMFAWYSDTDPEVAPTSYETYNFPSIKSKEDNETGYFTFENVETLEGFFAGHNNTTGIVVTGNFYTQRREGAEHYLQSISGMFKNCTYLQFVDINPDQTGFTTQYVEDMSYLFANCANMKSTEWDLPYSGYNNFNFGYIFRTDNVKNVSYMFSGCSSLENFSVYNNSRPPEFYEDESYRITNAVGMLSNCPKLEDVDLDGVYINANASVFVTYAISVPAYSNMFTIYEEGNTRGNDNIKHIHIPEYWCYKTMTSEITVQYNSIPLGSCGLASTYHDSNEKVLWLMGDASDPSSITYKMQNFISNELGSWYYINKGPEQRQVKIYGDFYRASYSAAMSPSSQRYDMDYVYAIYNSAGEQIDGGSTSYNIIAWNDAFKAEAYIGPCSYPSPSGGEWVLDSDEALIRVMNNDGTTSLFLAEFYGPSPYSWTINGEAATAGMHELKPDEAHGLRSWNIVCAPATPYLESQQNDSDAPAVEMPATDDNQSAVDSGSDRLKDSVDKLETTKNDSALLGDNMQEMSAAEYAVTLISLFTLPTPFSIFGFFLEILV